MNDEQIEELWTRVTGFSADDERADIAGFARALLAASASAPMCEQCGDGIVAHNPGICGTCHAIAASASAEPIYQVRKVGQLKWQDMEQVSMSMFTENADYETRIVYAAPRTIEAPDNSQEVELSLANADWRSLYDMVYGHECTFKSFMATVSDLSDSQAVALSVEQERAQFEAWFDREYPRGEDGSREKYRDSNVGQLMVAAWKARAALSAPANPSDKQEAVARYIVIGYGESDYPQAEFVNEREQLLDAVLGMIYTTASNADEEIREAYAKDLTDDDEWSEGIWRTEFEIGGIVVYDLGYAAPLAQSAEQDRIDAERYRKWVSYSGFTKEHCDATLDPIKINEHAAKGAAND